MKIFNFNVSVTNGSPEVISQSSSKWNGVSERCYIRIGKDSISYSIKSLEDFKLSEKFIVSEQSEKIIKIENVDLYPYILDKDEVELMFKEYEVFDVENIIESGSGYKKGDILFASGGDVIESFSGKEENTASFEITGVSNKGEVRMIKLLNSGRYSTTPNSFNITSTNGIGSGCQLNIEFRSKSERSLIRREILNVIPEKNTLTLFLDQPVSKNQKAGVLTLSKQKIILETNYMGVSSRGVSHEIIRDFTPNYRLPFAAPNSQNIEFVFNQAMSILDRELKRIESRISSTDD